ncbi:septum formation initiator family protein [Patescibacteria group bacterium]
MKKIRQEASFRRLLRSKLLLSIEVVLLVLISMALGREIVQRYTIEREIAQLKSEFEELEQKNVDLEQLIGYFKSETFKEEEARTKLGLKLEGESVVLLPESSQEVELSSNDEKATTTDQTTNNPKKWLKHFFGIKDS